MFADEKNIIIRINECYYEVLLTLEIGIFRISLCNILQKNVNNTQRKFKFYQIYMSGVSFENKVNCDENKKKELKKNTIIEHVAVFRLKEISEQKKTVLFALSIWLDCHRSIQTPNRNAFYFFII